MNNKSNVKVALVSSVGGHLTQIRQLEKLYKHYDYFIITEETELTRDMAEKESKVFFLRLINRKMWNFPYLLMVNSIRSFYYLLKEKPDVIISTGALSTVPFCLIGKLLLRKKLIYIESFAKMDTPTLTGRFLYRFADLFIVQWEKMLEYYPKAVYGGSIY
ncbi:PssD/Cps14F family polysaccharide biosynthesis glycosyltransferase [Paenibacillus xylaniclasticus]|uniref:PssD/Cps14F family polysaccharide biosynthesis glycosyltransferase n=1 Tax=Paenibacillus xylaniclasticus TaxID=588083 RepID=UPI000FD7B3BD|nr:MULTISPECIES: PssD/Cps14F family polysaccharide biosynthesis glycosyltransferase [Paenibacillus]GFN32766.1 UDP-N-acetylglucosamine--LPS N-acetylglucosamine transferase [Paenibacillus curdlanolyticus]